MTFFIGKDLDHHITANIVMNAVGIRDSLTEILRAFQFLSQVGLQHLLDIFTNPQFA